MLFLPRLVMPCMYTEFHHSPNSDRFLLLCALLNGKEGNAKRMVTYVYHSHLLPTRVDSLCSHIFLRLTPYSKEIYRNIHIFDSDPCAYKDFLSTVSAFDHRHILILLDFPQCGCNLQ